MNQRFDQEIREEIRSHPVDVPDQVHDRLEQLLTSLPEKEKIRSVSRIPHTLARVLATAACLLLVFLVVLPMLVDNRSQDSPKIFFMELLFGIIIFVLLGILS